MHHFADRNVVSMKAPRCPFNEIAGKVKMLSLEVRTGLSTEELSSRLRSYFGKDGLGLDLKGNGPVRYTFEGNRGFVSAHLEAAGDKTLLRITTSDWAAQVKAFVTALP